MTKFISRFLLANSFMAIASSALFAQLFPVKNYPQGYFGWPVVAAKGLAANFGELRPNHYHMGLDCRTDQVENRQVLAAADGYIARVKVEPYGFGRCIYINHPNGLTTLYAHLNAFNPALEKYITEQQYRLESWRVFLDIPANLFPVKKAQFIAYSGNTGGSQGPHTHFEIRDTKTDKVLNPLLFGFPLTDNIPPDIIRLAVYDRCVSTYEQTPKFYQLKKVAGKYVTVPSVIPLNTDRVSFAITAYDRYTGSTNKNGIYQSVLFDNGSPVVGFQLDSISYDETRYLNAHIDYKLKASGGSYVQHLSRLPGYTDGIYKQFSGDGVIDLTDGEVHNMLIDVTDASGNTSTIKFSVKTTGKTISPYSKGDESIHEPKEFFPGFINVFENDNVHFYLGEKQLYDSFRFRYNVVIPGKGLPIYQLQNGLVPVHAYFPVSIKYAEATNPEKMVMHRYWGDKDDYTKAQNEYPWFTASFRAFGNFQLLLDETPPVVTPIGFSDGMNASRLSRIAFAIKDNTEELKNFRAELDGKWLRFTNDKGRVFIYKFDENCPKGKHELKISVEDCVGNRTEKIYHFTR